MRSTKKTQTSCLHVIGFGSQGTAWSECLRDSGFQVRVYLRKKKSASWRHAQERGFSPQLLTESLSYFSNLPAQSIIVFACSDEAISDLYQKYFQALPQPFLFIILHGLAMNSTALHNRLSQHSFALLAPKSIGPALRQQFLTHFKQQKPHGLLAAIHASKHWKKTILGIAHGLGFQNKNLIETSFEQEALADLLSEQLLLCGGLFFLLQETIQIMLEYKIPLPLIQQECLTELQLIASLLNQKGPGYTFKKISSTAQFGCVSLQKLFQSQKMGFTLRRQAKSIQSGAFLKSLPALKKSKDFQDYKKKMNALSRKLAYE